MDHSAAPPSIRVSELTFRYFSFGAEALKNISLEIPSGRRAAVLGPTAAGKTTLLQILSGISGNLTTAQATGLVEIGKDKFDPIPRRVLFPAVGYFMQDPVIQLSGVRDTVEEEVAFTLDNLGLPQTEQPQRIQEALSRMNLLHLRRRNPMQISGGELQRALLASFLAARPSVLLLDEPTNSLDPSAQYQLAAILRSLTNATVVFTDYQLELALQVADLFFVLNHGKLLFAGNRTSFLGKMKDFQNILPVDPWVELLASLPDGNRRPFAFLRKQ